MAEKVRAVRYDRQSEKPDWMGRDRTRWLPGDAQTPSQQKVKAARNSQEWCPFGIQKSFGLLGHWLAGCPCLLLEA